MFKKIGIIIFSLLTLRGYAEERTRVQTTQEKIDTINRQLSELKKKQTELENLKAKFMKESVDLTKPLPKRKRPKIGLVLSGGGAKGAAEIGVLKVIEELKIPIDFVVGTSIGSIVGGMYSVGYTPEEIQKVVSNLDFVGLLLGGSDRKLKTITQKADIKKYPLTLSIDTNKLDMTFPTGVTDGQNVYFQLKDIFERAESVDNFEKLPINFTAITTNLQTGEMVKVKKGDIALATFKSMAIPTVLVPVNDKGKFYVDGGVINNFAIEEAIDMGADIIIAVDISADESKITNDSNIITVLDKISSYRGIKNVDRQKGYADILITPNVKNHGTLDFKNLGKLVDEGEKAANKVRGALSKLSNPIEYNKIRTKAKELKKNKNKEIENIVVNTKNDFVKTDIEKMKPKKKKMTQQDLDLWAKKIYALDYVDRVFYDVNSKEKTIEFEIVENLKSKLQGGVSYVSNYGASLQIAGTVPAFGKTKRRSDLKIEFSKYPKIGFQTTNFYNYFNNTFTSSFELGYRRDPLFFYQKDHLRSTYATDSFQANYYLGTSLYQNIFLGYNFGYKNTKISYLEGADLDRINEREVSGENENQLLINTGFLYIDTLDSKVYPHNGGVLLMTLYNGVSVEDKDKNYSGYSINLGHYWNYKRFTVGGTIFNGYINKTENTSVTEIYTLGGLRNQGRNYPFYGLPNMGIYTDRFLMGQAEVRYDLLGGLNLIFKYNMATLDSENIYTTNKRYRYGKDKIVGYGGGIAWDTFLGPIELIVSNNVLGDGALFQAHIGYNF